MEQRSTTIVIRGFWVWLIALVTLMSCDSNSDPPSLVCTNDPIPGPLVPMEVGNYWDYDILDHKGEVTDSARFEILEEIFLDELGGANRQFVANWHDIGSPAQETREIWTDENDGTHFSGFIMGVDTAAADFLRFGYPATPGDVFVGYDYTRDSETGILVKTDTSEYTLVAVDEIIQTPAGRFSTYVYKVLRDPPGGVLWGTWLYLHYAPGFGLVARVVWPGRAERQGEIELQFLLRDYCLKLLQ
ncbi:MAG: hypothetical protein BMS9Abin05_2710 [Rhodothermia bacterium]|nr:MAG: hypothetical protein BMS9Abin05_2710 [Rhodothermia bacterium]